MHRIIGKIFNILFNRLTLTVAAFVLQTYLLGLLTFRFVAYAEWIDHGFKILAVVLALYIIYRDYNPAYKIGWLFLLGLLPIFGSVVYLLFGSKRPARSLKKRIDPVESAHREDLEQEENLRLTGISNRLQRTAEYVSGQGPYPAWSHTSARRRPAVRGYAAGYLRGRSFHIHRVFHHQQGEPVGRCILSP